MRDISLFLLLVLTAFYGTYKLGRVLERKALTGALVKQIEGIYQDGYTDGYARRQNEILHFRCTKEDLEMEQSAERGS